MAFRIAPNSKGGSISERVILHGDACIHLNKIISSIIALNHAFIPDSIHIRHTLLQHFQHDIAFLSGVL